MANFEFSDLSGDFDYTTGLIFGAVYGPLGDYFGSTSFGWDVSNDNLPEYRLVGENFSYIAGVPVGGTVTAIEINFPSSPRQQFDLEITGLSLDLTRFNPITLNELFTNETNDLFWRLVLAGDDTIDFGSTPHNIAFAGDGLDVAPGLALRGGNDTMTGNISHPANGDKFGASGDFRTVAAFAAVFAGNDSMTLSVHGVDIFGDAMDVAGYLRGGSDSINITVDQENIISGDVRVVLDGGTVVGGDDTIVFTGSVFAVVGDATHVATGGNLIGGDDVISGGDQGDIIYGDVDMVDGAAIGGDDEIRGGLGNDTIHGDGRTGNADAVFTGGNDQIFGDGGQDTLFGNGGNDRLDGGTEIDFLFGGTGNDTYIVDAIGDEITEAHGEGYDEVLASATYVLAAEQSIENMATTDALGLSAINLTGNALRQTITGNDGANRIDSGKGVGDTLSGLGGADLYIVRNAGDGIVELADGGSDTVAAAVTYTLTAGAHVERLQTSSSSGTAAIGLTGNALAQTVVGNAGDNRIDGGAGAADILQGRAGDDLYIIRNAGDVVVETVNQGSDTVAAAVTYTLTAGAHVERLQTSNSSGTASIGLTGNGLAQTISGNAGDNRIDSGKGISDTLVGRDGDDLFIIRNAGDDVVEKLNEGNDTVAAAVSYTLSTGAHVERLQTSSSSGTTAINLTGNELAQTIVGNAGANILRGVGGTDTLTGLGGDDRFSFRLGDSATGSGRDVITDFQDRGDNDTIDLAAFSGLLKYIGTQSFTAENQVRVLIDGDDLRIQINTVGISAAESEILLLGTTLSQINASDFLL